MPNIESRCNQLKLGHPLPSPFVCYYFVTDFSKVLVERNDWTPPMFSIASRCDCGMSVLFSLPPLKSVG